MPATRRAPPPPSDAPHEPRLARIATLVADPSRARILAFLLSGEYASAGELARTASVSAATASAHLVKLVDAGLLACEPRGRHRYFRIADADVAHALEALAMVAERSSHDREWSAPARQRLREARCCYGHLAGRRGVALFEHLLDNAWLVDATEGYALTDAGVAGLARLGFDATALRANASQRVAYRCLDWSERRDHLAGKLASGLLDHFIERGWLRRIGSERALELTPPGRQALAPLLAID
ncbi:MAG TPA: helix-turn-helix transcriptional regulator [Burkholderiaceae bacterium]|jgi:DNA-binding transcriptional ArsR family regulator|nr:helix-turn-helix transcriptional regulator [Burkholderiaceae bacterium]